MTHEHKLADKAFKAGLLDEAEHHYRMSLESNPNSSTVASQLGALSLWNNNLSKAESYFNQSLLTKSWLARFLPNPQTHANLAITYARAGRFDKAAKSFRNAAKPIAFGPLKHFNVLAEFYESFGSESPYQIPTMSKTTVPFIATDPVPVIRVSVNGFESANFFIDTGGEGLFLDQSFANSVKALQISKMSYSAPGTPNATIGYGKVDRIRLGDLEMHNVPIAITDLDAIDKSIFTDTSVVGIVGTGILMQFLSTLDYKNEQLVLRQPMDDAASIVSVLSVKKDDLVVPMRLVATHLIFSMGSLGNEPPKQMFIDTGLANAGAMISKYAAKKLQLPLDWSKTELGEGIGGTISVLHVNVPSLTLGESPNEVLKQNVPGIVNKKEHEIFGDALGFEVGGLISHSFFRDSTLSFDFRNMNIIMQQH